MKIKIYQIDMGRDTHYKAFRPIENEDDIERDIYDLKFEGVVQDGSTLEDIFVLFNAMPANDMTRSLSVSDIVEFPEKGTAYICQNVGWMEIAPFGSAAANKRRTQAIDKALKEVASQFGMTVPELKREIFTQVQNDCDCEDIKTWLSDQGYQFDDGDLDVIAERLRDHYDSDYGIWDNISGAVDAVAGYLSSNLQDSLCLEKRDDDWECK